MWRNKAKIAKLRQKNLFITENRSSTRLFKLQGYANIKPILGEQPRRRPSCARESSWRAAQRMDMNVKIA